MQVQYAMSGDVVLDASGKVWQRGDTPEQWSTFGGPVVFMGPWKPSYGPQGTLILLVRNGTPVFSTVPVSADTVAQAE